MSRPGLRSVVAKVVVFTALSGLLTTIVITSLLDVTVGSSAGYTAEFANASGLEAGDTVRIAGVEVGKVGAVTLTGGHARISFSVASSQHLTTTTGATIHFANLLGQRFLALLPGAAPGSPLPGGGDIPLSRTTPALDLTAVFNGFAPLFSALAPDEVNRLAGSIIQVFQGEGGTVASLVSQTAVITNNLADRQQVLDGLLTNLAGLLRSVGAHDGQLGQLISSFDVLVGGLAGSRSQIAGAIDSLGSLNSQVAGYLGQSGVQTSLQGDIAGLADATSNLVASQAQVDGVLRGLPGVVGALAKVQSTGSYLNVYLCNLTINVTGALDISLIPGVSPAASPPPPFTLPSGPVGNQAVHTGTCA